MAGKRGLAEEIRAGLGSTSVEIVEGTRPMMTALQGGKGCCSSALDEVQYGKSVREHVKEFGALFGALSFFLAAWLCYKGKPLETVGGLCAFGVLFPLLGYLAPAALRPVWKNWMTFAHYLGIVMTFVMLSIAWSVLVIPLALILKIVGKKVVDMTYRSNVESYWITRKEKSTDFTLLERQF